MGSDTGLPVGLEWEDLGICQRSPLLRAGGAGTAAALPGSCQPGPGGAQCEAPGSPNCEAASVLLDSPPKSVTPTPQAEGLPPGLHCAPGDGAERSCAEPPGPAPPSGPEANPLS